MNRPGGPRIARVQPQPRAAIAKRYVTEISTMPRGRHPEGPHALSNAERQARFRARRQTQQHPLLAPAPHPLARRSRPQRWRDAVTELLALQTEYAAWLAALPDSLQDTTTAEALQVIVDLDLDSLADINPPRGYGRD